MNGITLSFYHWGTRLNEYLDSQMIQTYMSEIFSMYCAGATVEQAAQAITEIDRRPDL